MDNTLSPERVVQLMELIVYHKNSKIESQAVKDAKAEILKSNLNWTFSGKVLDVIIRTPRYEEQLGLDIFEFMVDNGIPFINDFLYDDEHDRQYEYTLLHTCILFRKIDFVSVFLLIFISPFFFQISIYIFKEN